MVYSSVPHTVDYMYTTSYIAGTKTGFCEVGDLSPR